MSFLQRLNWLMVGLQRDGKQKDVDNAFAQGRVTLFFF